MSLRTHVDRCDHPACSATRRLERVGARLVLGKGRHCEIAVVAAAGEQGLTSREAVDARRDYARHLGVTLGGPIQDADDAIHIEWAIVNHRGAEGAVHPINLGAARAVREGIRYRIRWPRGEAP